ncbi:MAG TPA: Hsp20/alpha crystallin family protein [Chitinophagaceae bacterium]|nr:Hsp20/alpha crystallin family protein [Chitinophagaceae bacterium]MCB9054446.1 Hsp20/alpha crystallin family protein [Chitinophagales bacterium]HRX92701.1 Hsp20/alpha crystallin family protein [Chitinophagaceae bacterium]
MDINEKNDEYIIYLAMPGMLREEIKVNISEKRLVVSAEKKENSHWFVTKKKIDNFSWNESFTLPADADTIMTVALFKNGNLEIHIPKGATIPEKEREVFIY